MKKLALAVLVAALGTVAAPIAVASAEEPLECKIVNGVGKKLTGNPVMYCIDDPNGPGDPF
jgi:hypothetical protein